MTVVTEKIGQQDRKLSALQVGGWALVVGGVVAAIGYPIVGIGMRTDAEKVYAASARSDMLTAVMLATGSSAVDFGTKKIILGQEFTDNDTIAVSTQEPDIEAAKEYVAAAAHALKGTIVNNDASVELNELAFSADTSAKAIINAVPSIDTDIHHNDVITQNDLALEAGMLCAGALGAIILVKRP